MWTWSALAEKEGDFVTGRLGVHLGVVIAHTRESRKRSGGMNFPIAASVLEQAGIAWAAVLYSPARALNCLCNGDGGDTKDIVNAVFVTDVV